MPAAPDARRVAFARFVKRAVDHARIQNGWAPADIAEAAGNDERGEPRLSRSTIYRWLRGEWKQDPLPGQVVAFCDALDIPTSAAFSVLWPGKTDRAPSPEPPPLDPDVVTLLRRLNDPNTPREERYLIKETLSTLAARATPKGRRADIDRAG